MRKTLTLAIVAMVTLLFSATISVSAQNTVNDEYKEAIGKMLKLSGATSALDMTLPQIVTMMKQAAPNAPDSLWDGFMTKMKTKFTDKIVEFYIPIYEKYLSLDDINQLIAFYETPIGKKLGEATPKITLEGMKIGQQLGMEIATELQNELKAGGY